MSSDSEKVRHLAIQLFRAGYAERDRILMFWFFIDIICAAAISGAAILLAEWFNASEGYHIFLVNI